MPEKNGSLKSASKSAASKAAATKNKRTSNTETSKQKITLGKVSSSKLPTKSASKSTQNGGSDNYTDPALRERIKQEVMAGDKGGKPGQWSARKAQLVAHEYAAQGGDYKHERDETQQHLKEWGDEKWQTRDGRPAIQKDSTSRYLPSKAWEELTPAEKKATDRKKKTGSKQGKQFVPNTEKAKVARSKVTRKSKDL